MPAESNQCAYHEIVRELSDRLVAAQRPVRVLDAVLWDESVQDAFLRGGGREQPPVDADYYARRPLGFDPAAKRRELLELEREIVNRLGQLSPVGLIMRRACREYERVVRMLEARGTPDFGLLSEELYGSTLEAFNPGDPTLADLGHSISQALQKIDASLFLEKSEKTITGEEAVAILQARLDRAFAGMEGDVRVILSDGIVADAAAGSNYIKIRKDARFDHRDLQLLEVHEGWVHLGTTYNGVKQPYCTFLSKGPPSATLTQEGLAVLMEVFAFASHPARLRRLTDRIRAVHMAEHGATFLDVYRFYLDQGFSEQESYTYSSRVFRGSTPTGRPFTKDITYSKGFILVYNFIRVAVKRGKLDRIPLLFCGKTVIEDIRILRSLVSEGLVTPPLWVPPQFADLHALTAWMCYADFLSSLDNAQLESAYAPLL